MHYENASAESPCVPTLHGLCTSHSTCEYVRTALEETRRKWLMLSRTHAGRCEALGNDIKLVLEGFMHGVFIRSLDEHFSKQKLTLPRCIAALERLQMVMGSPPVKKPKKKRR